MRQLELNRGLSSVLTLVVGLVASLGASGCLTPKGNSPQEKRNYVMKFSDEALEELFREIPAAKKHLENAPGYGTFGNVGSKIFFLATGYGFGVVVDNKTGKKTYMRMIEGGGGVGLGIKKYKAIYVFNSKGAMESFVTSGWQAGGDADAAVRLDDQGADLSVALTTDELTKPVTVYQFTDSGLALSAVVTGTKFYKDDELNNR